MMSQALLEPVPAGTGRRRSPTPCWPPGKLLAPFGYGLEPGDDGSAQLTRIPAELDTAEAVAGLQELAALLLEGHSPDPVAMRDTALHTIACKAAIKAGSPSGQRRAGGAGPGSSHLRGRSNIVPTAVRSASA